LQHSSPSSMVSSGLSQGNVSPCVQRNWETLA
jgi:hypothetical protein